MPLVSPSRAHNTSYTCVYEQVILEENIKVVETAGNNPGEYIKKIRAGGCDVIHKCTTIRHAETAVKSGASWISMDGFECAGHPGMADTGGLVLFAMAAKAFKEREINRPLLMETTRKRRSFSVP